MLRAPVWPGRLRYSAHGDEPQLLSEWTEDEKYLPRQRGCIDVEVRLEAAPSSIPGAQGRTKASRWQETPERGTQCTGTSGTRDAAAWREKVAQERERMDGPESMPG